MATVVLLVGVPMVWWGESSLGCSGGTASEWAGEEQQALLGDGCRDGPFVGAFEGVLDGGGDDLKCEENHRKL